MIGWLRVRVIRWLNEERPPQPFPPCDFERLSYEIRPGDVLLVEGRTRVAEVIKVITQSRWSHAALYIGRLYDIEDPDVRERLLRHHACDPDEQLVVEALLGHGTVVSPLAKYRHDNLRICRPRGLSPADAQKVIAFAVSRLGTAYDTRQILDLARFLFPWTLMPRRWRSSLFQHNAGGATRTVCSTMLAEAFAEVQFPVLPFVARDADGRLRLLRRNPKLFTPSDFDYSPYFEIIKYPMLGIDDVGLYRRLPWGAEGIVCNEDVLDCAELLDPEDSARLAQATAQALEADRGDEAAG
ncbi:YiiX/YebB-like N1pC/P60 family cysteine hydrolase [Inmirania thermothiophila]|uniref:Permuted papain-like amidase YaeF/Yiix C92 family enzyme n=1 Tax=Inmirania thermothiophila TaxID=1750597 RepID=A0A3N1Y1E3_9GAMM|nr:YiiX/YebB-like N1pC/P60 family cysteine hydrolase [Inmirania thermothiophila]ROR32338.1 permuted papain-like amidase YaeF/Yiix C92 family enzyme [Inmirania thermothiophila]